MATRPRINFVDEFGCVNCDYLAIVCDFGFQDNARTLPLSQKLASEGNVCLLMVQLVKAVLGRNDERISACKNKFP